jgi:hypothetical protein
MPEVLNTETGKKLWTWFETQVSRTFERHNSNPSGHELCYQPCQNDIWSREERSSFGKYNNS